jgi:peptide/nickel transport system substrate-binding protein
MAGSEASRRVSRRAFMRVSLVTGIAALLAVCEQPLPPRTAPAKPAEAAAPAKSQLDEWVIAFSEDISGLDPLTTTTGAIYYNVFYHIFDTLVGYEGPNFTPTPRLAESWSYVNENTLEMRLRKGVKFHNGDDFTADDVLYTYQGHKDNPKLGSGYVFDPVEKLEKIDSHTIRWTTKGAVASLMPNIAQVLFIVPKSRAKMGEEGFGKRPVGTGMYKLVADWTRDQPVRLTANEAYWGGPGAAPPRLQFKFIREPSTRVAELQNGTVHVAENIPLPQVELLKRGANTDVVAMKGARIIMHSFNLSKDPFTNVKVRQAVNHAIARDVVVKSLLQGYGQAHVGLFAPGWMGDGAKVEPYSLNVEKAKRLLADAGLPGGFEFEWQVTEGVFLKDREIAEAVAAQLKQAGITAKLKITERATIFANFFAGNYAVISTQWPTTADPDRYLQWLFIRTKAINDAKEADLVRQMMGEARRILDPAKRVQKYQEMSKLVYDSAMLMFVHVQDELYGINKRTGWTPYPVRAIATMHWYATHPTIKR